MKGLKGAEAWFHEIVSSILNEIAESPKKEGTLITLLGHLYSKGFITGDDVAKGFETLVGILDDMIIDVPAFADMLGRALSPLVREGPLGLGLVCKIPSLKSQRNHTKLVAVLLKDLRSAEGDSQTSARVAGIGGLSALVDLPADKFAKWVTDNVRTFSIFLQPEPSQNTFFHSFCLSRILVAWPLPDQPQQQQPSSAASRKPSPARTTMPSLSGSTPASPRRSSGRRSLSLS